MAEEIADRFNSVLEKIETSAIRSGRNLDQIQLVVVTKGQSSEKIEQVMNEGARILGENYPEETHKKILELGPARKNVEWHMIGHLQSRKIKFVVEDFSMIHSIDRAEIALDLSSKLEQSGKKIPALIEVNLSGEESKHGFSAWNEANWPALVDEIEKIRELIGLKVTGLMTMPPFAEKAEDSRSIFKKCFRLIEFYQKKTGNSAFNQLSMGTSLDFEVAVEEGATYIRVGEAIMGNRNYLK